MKILNFGSLNIDYVYHTDHFVTAGETTSSDSLDKNVGGKGLNQSVAFAKAGGSVFHAGLIGEEGQFLVDYLNSVDVNTSFIRKTDIPTGHAIIQIDKNGQNCILLYGGANRVLTHEYIDSVLENFSSGDMIVLQNEVNNIEYIIGKANEMGLITVFNPSPISKELLSFPLDKIDWFIMNEIEGAEITGKSDTDDIIETMRKLFPSSKTVLTLGKQGAVYFDADSVFSVPAGDAKPVDTTAAGDTFTGYFFSAISSGASPKEAMILATKASNITVSRKGAAESIPYISELR